MEKKNISAIIRKYLSGRFSSKTEERIQKWIIKDRDEEEKKRASLTYWEELKNEINSDTYSALNRVNGRIGYLQEKDFKILLYRKISRIAAVIIPLFILAGGYLYYDSTSKKLLEVSVVYGEERHMFLPDSSEIWLNAGTTIKYPQKFRGNQRVVWLDGEAYFSVKNDKSKAFIVQTEKLSIKVLGTQFNVKAYAGEEKAIATLTSGRVEVNIDDESRTLKPNEQFTFNSRTSSIEIVQIATNEAKGWITGQLIFNNSSFHEILQTLERRFDVSFHNNTSIESSRIYTVKFMKNENIEDILDILVDVAGFTYQKENDKIILNNIIN